MLLHIWYFTELPLATLSHNFREKPCKLGLARGQSEPWGPEQKRLQSFCVLRSAALMCGGESRLLLDKKFLLLKEEELRKTRGFQLTKYIFTYIYTQIYKELEPPETHPDFCSRKTSAATGSSALRKANKVLF